ncbi:Bro-N domain-containing protein [Paenibacillus sp. CMAA1739]|uniref:BRO-N domain-containing protein n=1 Tax=Paenibacillus ottowii TaxID=2315729 RepID=UPI002DB55B57|nr:Bro-N domain-containing protein [Paenibacillus sp. CMAA1739]MEC4565387.1 Bro-N domain-containing protein [Paenibacillus sp. CMAA1739]
MSNLIQFEGFNVEFLTKEDVIFDFEGDVIFHGSQSAELLGYKDTNDAIKKHVSIDEKYLITKEKLNGDSPVSLGQRGNWFVEEDGIFDLIYCSKLPKAREFKKTVKKVIKQIQSTGRYDEAENRIALITDETERELQMKLYAIGQVLKVDPRDQLVQIQYKDAVKSLEIYKQQQETKAIKKQVDVLTEAVERVQNENELIRTQQLFVCNRTNFSERIRILANKYFGRDLQQAYGELFNKMKLLGSFDVYARRKNEWEKMDAERTKEGKKPYSKSSLNKKYNCADVIDDYNKWELASEAYKTIETEFVQITAHKNLVTQ